jgi:glucokinase
MTELFAAVDLGGTTITCALGTAGGEIVARQTFAAETYRGPDSVLERIAECVAGLGKPVALGIGVPGLVDIPNGTTLFLPNLPTQWRNIPVAAWLKGRLGCSVSIMNDARVATLGELVFGAGRGVGTMLFFTLGTGIGGGVVIDGHLRLGPLGAAGELGHQTVVSDGPLCGCGNQGCLEAVASAPALIAEGVRAMRAGLAPHLNELTGGDASLISPRTMADSNDKAIRQAVERVGRYLGIGVSNLVSALAPDLVVFGGGMSGLGERLLAPVRAEVQKRVRMMPTDHLRIEISAMGEDAGIYGGIALAKGQEKWTTATNR